MFIVHNIQGVFFNWCSPKINKYGKKFKYQNWCPPKIYKYGEKLKYQNWCPAELVPPKMLLILR